MGSIKPTEKELLQGYQECKTCGGILLLEAGFEVDTSACVQCFKFVADKADFLKFADGVEAMSK